MGFTLPSVHYNPKQICLGWYRNKFHMNNIFTVDHCQLVKHVSVMCLQTPSFISFNDFILFTNDPMKIQKRCFSNLWVKRDEREQII